MSRTTERRLERLEALERRAALAAVFVYPPGEAPADAPAGFPVLLPDNGRGDRQAEPKPARS